MVSTLLLKSLNKVLPLDAGFLGETAEDLLDTRLHAFKSTHVQVCVVLLQHIPDFLAVFLHFILHIHLVAVSILVLVTNSIVIPELVASNLLHLLELVVVEEGWRGGHTKEQPGISIELEVWVLLHEVPPEEGSEWSNTGTSSKHNHVCLIVLGKEQSLADWTRDLDLGARGQVAEVVGADAADFFAILILVDDSLNAE